MACDPNTLIDQAKCYECNVSGTMYAAMEIALLCAIRDGTNMSTDPQSIIAAASCIFSCIPPGMMNAVKISLLCQILNN